MDADRAYTTYGNPEDPCIVFVHGIRLGRAIWESHARALASRYFVVTIDLPGHGVLCGVPFTTRNIDALFDHVFDNVCSSKPLVVGYSLGGYAAIAYACARPERIRALLLAGCTLDFEPWKRWPYEISARLSAVLPALLFERLIWCSLHLTMPRVWADRVVAIPFDRSVLAETSALTSNGGRFSEKLAHYPGSVLFVNGEYDIVFRIDERRFLRCASAARLKIVRRSDHTMPMRRAEEFEAIVREFACELFERDRRRAVGMPR
ncbi:MAG: alpha/beta fold hydrolase [Candidatus Eremiobacteraeota bacterium]|nr:alpha/beta fold hydrolase [Candidatus Eremiobacteraeota bacterium]